MSSTTKISRRGFLVGTAVAGGAMVMSVGTVGAGQQASPIATLVATPGASPAAGHPGAVEMAARLVINPDDSITVLSTKPEAGQGTSTTLAVFVCEELGSDPLDESMVHIEWGDPRRDILENNIFLGGTDGFHTWFYGRADYVRHTYQQAGASARERLKVAAAKHLGVPADELTVANNRVTHEASGQSVGFGAIAAAAASVLLEAEPAIREPGEWQLIGKPHRKQETPRKVSGRAVYGMDVELPGMLYGAVGQTPVLGGVLKSYDAEVAMGMTGVMAVIPLAEMSPSSILVIADSYWNARRALDAMPVEWEGGATDLDIEDIQAMHEEALEVPGVEVEDSTGETLAVLESADRVFEAVYKTPYRHHAVMEPRNATAIFAEDRIDIWYGSASHDSQRNLITRVLGVPPEMVNTHHVYIGGSFGAGRGTTDAALAVIASQAMGGAPVKLIWSRDVHTSTGMVDPFGMAKFQMSVDDEGWPEAFFIRKANQDWENATSKFAPLHWDNVGVRWMATATNLANPTITAPDLPPLKLQELQNQYYDGLAYRVPNHRVEWSNVETPLPVIAMRSPGLSSTVFMVESFIDEVAHETGKDPLELRYWLLREADEADPGWYNVLDLVADKAEWGKDLPQGSGQGIAVCVEHGTIIAAIAEVTVSREGDLTIDKVDVAFDAGYILNPDGALNQLEGSTLFGWSMAKNEELTIKGGVLQETNFDAYPLARMADAPRELNIHFDATSDYRLDAALGEATVPHMAAAVGNAIFAATGKRVRELPFRKADLSW